jgi:hypothetical protein
MNMTDRNLKLNWLSRGRVLRTKLVGLQAEVAELRSRADYAGISSGGSGSGSGNGSGNGSERKFLALIEAEAELAAVRQELERTEAEIRTAIAQVKVPIYQTYLRMRFLAYRSGREIAAETKYSENYIDSHVRKKAVDSVKMPANDC